MLWRNRNSSCLCQACLQPSVSLAEQPQETTASYPGSTVPIANQGGSEHSPRGGAECGWGMEARTVPHAPG